MKYSKILLISLIPALVACSEVVEPSKDLPVNLRLLIVNPSQHGNCTQKREDYENVVRGELGKLGWKFGGTEMLSSEDQAQHISEAEVSNYGLLSGQVAIDISLLISQIRNPGEVRCTMSMNMEASYYNGSVRLAAEPFMIVLTYPGREWRKWDDVKYERVKKFIRESLE